MFGPRALLHDPFAIFEMSPNIGVRQRDKDAEIKENYYQDTNGDDVTGLQVA
jgi:hypothetical protein